MDRFGCSKRNNEEISQREVDLPSKIEIPWGFSSQMLRVLAWFFESSLDWRLKMKLWRLGVNEVLTPEAYYL